jgi:hypothetical protein
VNALQRLLSPEQLEALVQARRHTRAGRCHPDGEIDRAGLLPEVLAQLFQRGLDDSGLPRIDCGERVLGRGENARVEQLRIRLDVVEEETSEPRELAEPSDLLLDDRR